MGRQDEHRHYMEYAEVNAAALNLALGIAELVLEGVAEQAFVGFSSSTFVDIRSSLLQHRHLLDSCLPSLTFQETKDQMTQVICKIDEALKALEVLLARS